MKKFFPFILLLFSACSSGPSKTYKVGIDPTFFPNDMHKLDVNLLAFCDQLLEEVSKRENIAIEKVFFSWDNLVQGLEEDKCDAILSLMRPYAFNLGSFDFSERILNTGPVLVVPMNSKVKNLSALDGRKVGVQTASTGEELLVRHARIEMATFNGIGQMLQAIDEEYLSGALVPALVAHRFLEDRYSKRLKVATSPLNDEGLRVVTKKGEHTALRKQFDQTLTDLKSEGTFEKMVSKWGL